MAFKHYAARPPCGAYDCAARCNRRFVNRITLHKCLPYLSALLAPVIQVLVLFAVCLAPRLCVFLRLFARAPKIITSEKCPIVGVAVQQRAYNDCNNYYRYRNHFSDDGVKYHIKKRYQLMLPGGAATAFLS